MGTTFPSAIDTFVNPLPTQLLSSPSHSGQHSDINDAVKAVESQIIGDKTNVKGNPYNAVGDGSTDDTAAFTAAITALGSRGTLFVPPGVFMVDPFSLPNKLDLVGAGRDATIIRNRNTAGNNFLSVYGSQNTIRDLTIDGNRAIQTGNAGAGLVIAKPNGTSGGATTLTGGVLLTAGVTAGDTQFTVSSASFGTQSILAGDIVMFLESGQLEMVRVAKTYTGGTTVTIERRFNNNFTVGALVSVASTNITVQNCNIFGTKFVGISTYHMVDCLIDGNYVRDYGDSGISLDDNGSRRVTISNNFVDMGFNGSTNSATYGIAVDTQSTAYGRTNNCKIIGNTIAYGQTTVCLYGIWLGSVHDFIVANNNIDMLLGTNPNGMAAIRVDQLANNITIANNHAIGTQTTNSKGIQSVYGITTAYETDRRLTITGNILRDFSRGIELAGDKTATIMGNKVYGMTNVGIDIEASTLGSTQEITVVGNLIDGSTIGPMSFGIRTQDTTARGILKARDNVIVNTSAKVTPGLGWELIPAYGSDTWAPGPIASSAVSTRSFAVPGASTLGAAHISWRNPVNGLAIPWVSVSTLGTVTYALQNLTTAAIDPSSAIVNVMVDRSYSS